MLDFLLFILKNRFFQLALLLNIGLNFYAIEVKDKSVASNLVCDFTPTLVSNQAQIQNNLNLFLVPGAEQSNKKFSAITNSIRSKICFLKSASFDQSKSNLLIVSIVFNKARAPPLNLNS